MKIKVLLTKLLAPVSIWRGKSELSYIPSKINVDPCNICNLGCTLCPSGTNSMKAPKGFMHVDTLKRVIEDFKGHIDFVSLYNWGEPLLNPCLPELIEMCNRADMDVRISTNLMDLTPEIAGSLARSSLKKVFVSCDGASQESYKVYHTKGDFDRVMDNMRMLLAEKEKARAEWEVVWLFHVFRHNEHELEKAKALSSRLGIRIQLNPMRTDMGREIFETRAQAARKYSEWIPRNPLYNMYKDPEKQLTSFCKRPWTETTIAWNGDVVPCCGVYETDKYSFGNIIDDDFRSIWNGEKYVSARKEIIGRIEDSGTICHVCRKSGYLHF